MNHTEFLRHARAHALWLAIATIGFWAAAMPAFAASNTNAYAVNTSVNTVTVIDTSTATIRGTVAVGPGPSQVAVSPNGAQAYVSHPSLGYVSIIDAAAMTVTGTITTAAGPTALAVAPDGNKLYVGTAGGVVQFLNLPAGTVSGSAVVPGTISQFAFSPDGSRAYVAAGLLSVIDTATGAATSTSIPATAIAMMPKLDRAYVSSPAGLTEVNTSTNTVERSVAINGTVGPLALTPDGSRLYAGVQGFNLVSSTYGTFSVAFRNVTAIETKGNTTIATISIGSPANKLAVTPNRSDLYMTISPSTVAIAAINTNRVRVNLTVGSGVNGLAITPDPDAVLVSYNIDAVNDTATVTTVSDKGGTPIANVLANDTIGGLRATLTNVTLTEVLSSTTGVRLNTATGAVVVDPGAAAGAHTLTYKICEISDPANCDQAVASLNVRLPYIINAVDDVATTNTGKMAVNVLTNDTLNALPATSANVRVTQLSASHPGLLLATNGALNVLSGTPTGPHTLVYRICEIASPTNCDDATASITVIPYVVDAVNDSGVTTRGGGTAVANVLANDRFGAAVATLTNVRLTLVSAASATGVALNLTNGAVTVAAGTPQGAYSLTYRICEIASPANCDDATVAVTVNAYLIDAVNDYARGSSKVTNTPLASVLANDTLAGLRATTATVRLSLVSLTPANKMVRLDLTDGSVDVLGKTDSGLHSLVYRICEIANPTNCDQATVSLDLSGSSD